MEATTVVWANPLLTIPELATMQATIPSPEELDAMCDEPWYTHGEAFCELQNARRSTLAGFSQSKTRGSLMANGSPRGRVNSSDASWAMLSISF